MLRGSREIGPTHTQLMRGRHPAPQPEPVGGSSMVALPLQVYFREPRRSLRPSLSYHACQEALKRLPRQKGCGDEQQKGWLSLEANVNSKHGDEDYSGLRSPGGRPLPFGRTNGAKTDNFSALRLEQPNPCAPLHRIKHVRTTDPLGNVPSPDYSEKREFLGLLGALSC